MAKVVEPSLNLTAFSCPRCGAHTTQHWHNVYAQRLTTEQKTPLLFNAVMVAELIQEQAGQIRRNVLAYAKRAATGELFLDSFSRELYLDFCAVNLHISQCFNCSEISLWKYDQLLYPPARAHIEPNEDLDSDIKRDFNEARDILNASPRGAAALLRLALQKLLIQLGETGSDINKDIASLVTKGLDPRMQRALDIVRVMGNESVHPGTIDLRDDRDTALKLFDLINAVAAQMLTHPREVEALYNTLPANKLAGIEARDAAAHESRQIPPP